MIYVGVFLTAWPSPWAVPRPVQVSDDEVKKVPQIGNSPTFISVEAFRTLAPMWWG